jgi:hypothetical protein
VSNRFDLGALGRGSAADGSYVYSGQLGSALPVHSNQGGPEGGLRFQPLAHSLPGGREGHRAKLPWQSGAKGLLFSGHGYWAAQGVRSSAPGTTASQSISETKREQDLALTVLNDKLVGEVGLYPLQHQMSHQAARAEEGSLSHFLEITCFLSAAIIVPGGAR